MGNVATPDIKYGNTEGQYFRQWRFDVLKTIVEGLANCGVSLENAHIWYDKYYDFHHLEFDLEGNHYDIRYYKVFTMTKNHEEDFVKQKSFGRNEWEAVYFFQDGKHKTWIV